MKYYNLTFQFDNEEKTLTRYNGLSIEDFENFIINLLNILDDKEKREITISEVRGNCYAVELSSPNEANFDTIKQIHTSIANGDYDSLNPQARKYNNKLQKLLKNELHLNIYNKNKSYLTKIKELDIIEEYGYFYQTNSYIGKLTKIGSRNLNTKNTMILSSYTTEIEINPAQESELIKYYKKNLLEVYVTEKINKINLKVENAKLDGFVILSELEEENDFLANIFSIREKQGEYFANTIDNDDE